MTDSFMGGGCDFTGTMRVRDGQITVSNIVISTTVGKEEIVVLCRVCRAEESLPSPTDLTAIAQARNRMEAAHKDCKEMA